MISLPKFKKLEKAQRADKYCHIMAKLAGIVARFTVDENERMFRKASINGSSQLIVPEVFREEILHNDPYLILTGQPGRRWMFDKLWWQFCCWKMAANLYNYLASCRASCRHSPSQKHQKWMQLFPSTGLLEIVTIDILGLLKKKRQVSWLIVVMMDGYIKLTWAIPYIKVTARVVAMVYLKHCIIPYGMPTTCLTNNGFQFVPELFCSAVRLCKSQASYKSRVPPAIKPGSGKLQ